MKRYQTILDRLDRRQKIALLSDPDSLSDYNINRTGIPAVRRASLDDLNEKKEIFPSFGELACSWDEELFGAVTEELAIPARGTGYNLLETPDLKCAVHPFSEGLSEDTHLNSTLGIAMARAAHAAGTACALSRFAVTERDVAPLDVQPDGQALHELFLKPFLRVMAEEPCEAVSSSLLRTGGRYADLNLKLFRAAAGGIPAWDTFPMADGISPDVDHHRLLAHGLCIAGASVTIDRAVGRFEQLSGSLLSGSASERDLRAAVDEGSAIDPALVDEAADRTIGFARLVASRQPQAQRAADPEALARRAAAESFVLLKNNGILPLARSTRLAVIGEGYEDLFSDKTFPVVMRSGMIGKDTGAEDTAFILKEAAAADVIVLFLQREEGEQSSLLLPNAQLSLAASLKAVKRPVIAVIKGSVPPDADVFRLFSAVLLAPAHGKYNAPILRELLTGSLSPSGRLTRTCCECSEKYYRTLKEDKETGRIKVGPFVGYRYFDTAGIKIKYPFGFGLTYTTFSYSQLTLENDRVCFTVKNTGKCRGCEVAQVYVGAPAAAFPEPKKKLAAFCRVELAPGEARRITLQVPAERYASYSEETLGEHIVTGEYPVYIGASVSDIRLRGVRRLEGDAPVRRDARPGDYFRNMSNIKEEYHADSKSMSRPKKNLIVRVIGYLLLFTALIVLITSCVSFAQDLVFATSERVSIVVFALLAIAAAVTLKAEDYIRKDKILQEKYSRKMLFFPDAAAKVPDADHVFGKTPAMTQGDQPAAILTDEPKFFDPSLTLEKACRELTLYLNERGIAVSRRDVADLIASFAATHLIFLPGIKESTLNAFCTSLSEHFETPPYADNASPGEGLLIRQMENGREKTALYNALQSARQDPSRIYVALIRGIAEEDLQALSFVRRAGRTGASFEDEGGDVTAFPPNLWIVATMQDDTQTVPEEIARIASFPALTLGEGTAADTPTLVSPFGYYQFANLCARVRDAFPLREQLWKRIDTLETRLGSDTRPYRFGNRIWIKLEMHISVCIACGEGEAEAVDSAVAAELLTGIASKAAQSEEGAAVLLEEIFGSEEIVCCRKLAERTELFRRQTNKWEEGANA